jgi:hypothetical protein
MTLAILILAALVQPQQQPAPAPSLSADELAAAVMKASGADAWKSVTRVRFTWTLNRPDGQVVQRKHDWDVGNMTDTVTVGDKTTTVKLVGTPSDEASKNAFQAWTNDSYWLLAPMKVMDAGVTRTVKPDETIDGKTYHVLHLSFANVGLTPGDQYDMFVDPETHLVRVWNYIPANKPPRQFTWDEYKDFKGVKLATEHKIGGKVAIAIGDVELTTR